MEYGLPSFASGIQQIRPVRSELHSEDAHALRSFAPPRALSSAPRGALATYQLLVRHAMRRVGVGAFPPAEISVVFFEVPLEPHHFGVPFKGEDVRRDSIEKPTIVADDDRASGEAEQRLLERAQRIDV